MYKFSLTTLMVVFFILNSQAQKDTLSKADKAALDSMMKADQFFKLMNEPLKNTVDVSIGVGNGSFSAHNQAVNATGIASQVVFTPSVVYRLKSGFNFGLTGYLTNDDSSKLELYQTGLTAGYDYIGKKVSAGGSLTHYFADVEKYNSKSLYQNDLYGYIKKSSGIIQPVFSFGFSNGKYRAIDVINIRRPLQGDTTVRDSTHNKTSYFYTSIGAEHDFYFYGVFSKGDELDFIPSLVINAGTDKTVATHVNQKIPTGPVVSRVVAKRRTRVASSDKFQLQSIAASFDFTYSVGKFFIQPNLYLDYYLPSTTANRLSAVYSLTAGFSF